jgi:hypothetical protein
VQVLDQILADFSKVLPKQIQPMQDGVGSNMFDPPNGSNAIAFNQQRHHFQDHRQGGA